MTAALAFLRALLGALTNPAALLLIALAYTAGHFKGGAAADGKCNAAALQSKIDALVKDRDAANASARRFEVEAQANATQAEKNSQIIREIERAPKRSHCRLTDADNRRVYGGIK